MGGAAAELGPQIRRGPFRGPPRFDRSSIGVPSDSHFRLRHHISHADPFRRGV